jgi:hypothetical protein
MPLACGQGRAVIQRTLEAVSIDGDSRKPLALPVSARCDPDVAHVASQSIGELTNWYDVALLPLAPVCRSLHYVVGLASRRRMGGARDSRPLAQQ